MAGLSGGTNISFVVVGVDLVLAFVMYQDRKKIKKNARLNDHMTIQTLIDVDDSSEEEDEDSVRPKKAIKARVKRASNRIGIESDFSVLLEKPNKDIFGISSKYGEQPVSMPARVTIEENARIAPLEVKAVHNLCHERDNPHAQFQEMLLAEDAARAPPKNVLLKNVGCSQSEIHAITETVIRKLINVGKAPNADQTVILWNAGVTEAKFKCMLGPPGTGKTTTIAALTEIYTRCPSVGALLCAPSNGNTGRSTTPSARRWPYREMNSTATSTKPQRVYRVHLEEEHLLKNHNLIGHASRERLDKARAARFMEAACRIAAGAAWYER